MSMQRIHIMLANASGAVLLAAAAVLAAYDAARLFLTPCKELDV